VFRELKDILIITDSGKVVASKISNKNIDESLFGMLISALTSYASEIYDDKLNSIEFNKIRFDFLKRNSFIFMASSSVKTKHDKALKILKIVSDVFFQRYPKSKLEEWDGNLNIFQELSDDIKKSIDELFIELIFKENKPKTNI
jgi:hypothetical protein